MKPTTTFTLTTYSPKDKVLTSATHVFKSVDKTGGGMKATVEMEIKDDKDKPVNKSTYDMVCENGTVKLNMRDFGMGGMAMPAGNVEMEFTGDELTLPATLKSGETLPGANFGIIARMGEVKIMDRNYTIKERKIEGTETISTPAGKFDCYKVTYLTETQGMIGKTRTFRTVTWYAKGPGMVRNESYDEKDKMTGYTVLTSYNR
jgi:hypothetical protein